MLQRLASHNEDVRRLIDRGYALSYDGGHLVARDIPYLDSEGELQIGALVSKVVSVDEQRVAQDDHQMYFAGSVPHGMDRKPVPNLGGGAMQLPLGEVFEDVVVQRSFSNKPRATGKFVDFFDKFESYVGIISAPATELYGTSPYTFRSIETAAQSVFKLHDTLTSRAEITDLAAKFKDDIIVIIGLGGTGAYVLDFVVKTPVREIRAFDIDLFHVHNAYRSPGRLNAEELSKKKSEVYHSRYENFRNGLSFAAKFIDGGSEDEVAGATFAFVCVDKGSSRAAIFDLLLRKGIPFIDVGMGLNRKHGPIGGMLRTTSYSLEDGGRRREMNLAPLTDARDDIYRTNIQIAELNALNAAMAVLRFKQLRGFYRDESKAYNLLFGVDDLAQSGSKLDDEV